jgi:hypothetical protein
LARAAESAKNQSRKKHAWILRSVKLTLAGINLCIKGQGSLHAFLQQLHRFLAFSQLSQPATNQFGCHVQPNVPTILPRLPRVAAAGSIRQAAPNPIVESSVMRLFRAHVAFERRLKRQAHLLRATVSQPGPV